jgi:hypothetical protein
VTSINHYGGVNQLTKPILLEGEKFSSSHPTGLSSTMSRPESYNGTSSQHQHTAPESQKPQVNQEIKAGFYIRKKPTPDKPKPSLSSRVQATQASQAAQAAQLTTNSPPATPALIRRKRRSLSGRSALMSPPTPTVTDTFGSSLTTSNRPGHLLRSVSDSHVSASNDSPSIVMTGMTEQEKQSCFRIISILGTYRSVTR